MGGLLAGGWTGDPDTTLVEEGGFLGLAIDQALQDAGMETGDEPLFNSPEDQADGAPVLDGGLSGDEDTGAGDVSPEFPTSGEDVEEAVASGWTRDLHDWLRDYEGEWQGEEDRHDIVGPSISLSALGDPNRSFIGWRSDQSQEEDPTNPENFSLPWWAWAGLLLLVLILLSDYADLAASATPS